HVVGGAVERQLLARDWDTLGLFAQQRRELVLRLFLVHRMRVPHDLLAVPVDLDPPADDRAVPPPARVDAAGAVRALLPVHRSDPFFGCSRRSARSAFAMAASISTAFCAASPSPRL